MTSKTDEDIEFDLAQGRIECRKNWSKPMQTVRPYRAQENSLRELVPQLDKSVRVLELDDE